MSYRIQKEKKIVEKKKTNFNQVVSAILIPSIKDMEPEMLKQLWWDKNDYILFCISANNEIEAFLKIHSDLKRKDAIRLLYDHSIICYDKYLT